MGPVVGRMLCWPSWPVRRGATKPLSLTRPAVGLKPYTPQKCAGMRMLPPMSVPRPMGEHRALTSEPSPPDEPPGVWPALNGLMAAPQMALRDSGSIMSCGTLDRTKGMAPAARSAATNTASSVAGRNVRHAHPQSESNPAMST